MSPIYLRILFCVFLAARASCVATVEANEDSLVRHLKTCKQSDENYSSCLKTAIQDWWSTYFQDNPSLDPYKLDTVEIFKDHLALSNLEIRGLAELKVLEARPQIGNDSVKLDLDVELPRLLAKMDYEGGGSFGSLNISSRGHVDTSTTDLKSTWSLYGHVENDKWTVDQFKIKVNNGGMRNGDIPMAEELQPIMGEIMNSRLPRFVNELMFSNNVSVSQLFPK